MFRGSARAKLDEKGRLKLPAAYLTPLLERFGAQLFITSMDGVSAQVYPLPVWLELEAKLAAPSGLLDPDLERFRMTVNYWGREVELDAQGRVVIHSPLREAAGLDGDCVVMGDPSGFLTLISQPNAEAQVAAKPLTRKERARVAEKLRGGSAEPAAEKTAEKPPAGTTGRQL